jgi:Flp pilus assembly protein TadD
MPQANASRMKLNEVVQLINAGQADKAEALCRDAVERDPRDVNMVALLGATLFKTRQVREAEKFLREAIELAPNFAKPHEDLGILPTPGSAFWI